MKPKSRWPDAHHALRRLYAERVPPEMTQKEFGATYDIGTQGMVWQYLHGHRPLNYEAAAKFARALRCTIYDISPAMAASLEQEILPVLGRSLRRAAVLAALALSLPALLSPAPAGATGFERAATVYYVKFRAWLRRLLGQHSEIRTLCTT